MGNLGSGELLVIFFVALIVLGPTKLPEAARQIGRAINEVRRVSGGFQREMREAMKEPIEAIDDLRRTASGPFDMTPTGEGPVKPAQSHRDESAASTADDSHNTAGSTDLPDAGKLDG